MQGTDMDSILAALELKAFGMVGGNDLPQYDANRLASDYMTIERRERVIEFIECDCNCKTYCIIVLHIQFVVEETGGGNNNYSHGNLQEQMEDLKCVTDYITCYSGETHFVITGRLIRKHRHHCFNTETLKWF